VKQGTPKRVALGQPATGMMLFVFETQGCHNLVLNEATALPYRSYPLETVKSQKLHQKILLISVPDLAF